MCLYIYPVNSYSRLKPLPYPEMAHPLCSLLSPSLPPSLSFTFLSCSPVMRHGGSSHHCPTRSRGREWPPFNTGNRRDINEFPRNNQGYHYIVLIVVTLFPSRGPKGSDELTSKYGFHYTGTYKWVDTHFFNKNAF